MTDHPILFSAPMIRALLDGRKTQTRRLAWRIPPTEGWMQDEPVSIGGKPTKWQKVKPGEKLWVRESIRIPPPITTKMRRDGADTWPTVMYDADLDTIDRDWCKEHDWKSLPSIHMPRRASRLTLIVTAVRIERLYEISHDDAIAEGIEINPIRTRQITWLDYSKLSSVAGFTDPRLSYRTLWISINGPKSWNANPEVVVITFDVVKENIDRLGR